MMPGRFSKKYHQRNGIEKAAKKDNGRLSI